MFCAYAWKSPTRGSCISGAGEYDDIFSSLGRTFLIVLHPLHIPSPSDAIPNKVCVYMSESWKPIPKPDIRRSEATPSSTRGGACYCYCHCYSYCKKTGQLSTFFPLCVCCVAGRSEQDQPSVRQRIKTSVVRRQTYHPYCYYHRTVIPPPHPILLHSLPRDLPPAT